MSPSIVVFIFSRKYAICPTRYLLILLNSMIVASRLPWCDVGWKAPLDPLSGNTRFCASRPVLNEMTRVRSVCSASTWMSNISFMCSENESGTPAGASGSSRASPLLFCASTILMRRSTSVTKSRYCSMRARSATPSWRLRLATSPWIQSRMLRRVTRRSARASGVPPAPNSMSKATRGSRIIGSGSFGDAQLIVSV